MGSRRRDLVALAAAVSSVLLLSCLSRGAYAASFGDNFEITGAEDHVKTSADGQTWYLYLDNKTGVGFQTKERYLFGWFSMKLKLVGNDSAGVVTAYYVNDGSACRCALTWTRPRCGTSWTSSSWATGRGSPTSSRPTCTTAASAAGRCATRYGSTPPPTSTHTPSSGTQSTSCSSWTRCRSGCTRTTRPSRAATASSPSPSPCTSSPASGTPTTGPRGAASRRRTGPRRPSSPPTATSPPTPAPGRPAPRRRARRRPGAAGGTSPPRGRWTRRSGWTTPGSAATSSSTTTATTARGSRRRPRSARSGTPRDGRARRRSAGSSVEGNDPFFRV